MMKILFIALALNIVLGQEIFTFDNDLIKDGVYFKWGALEENNERHPMISEERINFGNMIDGLKEGKWRSWTKSGKQFSEGHYKRGVKIGHWTEIRTGVPPTQIRGYYRSGRKSGEWAEYTLDGAFIRLFKP